ncbi:MAG: phosphoribosylaminoimidazolesuccinocarboxamide synthase [bacterium]
MAEKTLRKTNLTEIDLFKRGKVRDVYDLGDKLLVISTDRISCFDVVLPSEIPHKGEVLTKLSLFWFEYTSGLIANHLITADVDDYPQELMAYKPILENRSMLVRKAKAVPVECVVRGYLSGSGWKEYQESQSVCGIKLPAGLKESDKLPEPIFTPSTKEEVGHDINVTQGYIEKELGKTLASKLKELSVALYQTASEYAETEGIIIADTKFEFGTIGEEIILIDEALTPDSSRFWPKDEYAPGKGQPSFDKQYVRDYLESLEWNKKPPAPELPEEIIAETSKKYLSILELLTK